MHCPGCDAKNQSLRRYCRECGALLSLACEHCSFDNEPNDRFCGSCGRSLERAAAREPPAPPGRHWGAERRQVTLAFIDLVGSTALGERLDPEDLGALLHAYRDAAGAIIERLGGYVAQFTGDGILAYFGYPRAHEDDAAHAVHAALEIGPAVSRLQGQWTKAVPVELAIRAGVHTGQVVVGALGTDALAQPLSVVGSASNVAARIQSYAEPGTVMITGATWRLVQGRFECEDLGRHPMRGVREPVHILRVLRPSDRVTRFEAATALSSLVGRDAELQLILDRWALAREGRGGLVHVCGEPGIGKSRLVRAVEERIAAEPHRILRCQCSLFAAQSTLHPIVLGLQRAAGFLPDDGPLERLDKLVALLEAVGQPLPQAVPLYAALLKIPFEHRYPDPGLTPARQKELTLAALTGHVQVRAGEQPLLLVVEDAQWIDPTSLEFLDLLAQALAGSRILLLVTSRPGFRHAWPGIPVTDLRLPHLGPEASLDLIAWVTRGKALPAELVAEIVRKTEGVPLFIEELTRTILESGVLRETAERYELRGPLPALDIPATLQESLLARLDRLGPAREVAHIAASIGKEFSHRLLAEIAGLTPTRLDQALSRLAHADLVSRDLSPQPTYSFRHALIRDIAYGSLLRSQRQELHTRIARTLPRIDPDSVATRPELLAYHLTEAGELDEAVEQWLRAGQRASALSANPEAVAHLSRGLDLLQRLPDDEAHRQRRLEFLVSRGPAQIVLRGSAAPEVVTGYTDAVTLAAGLPEGPTHFAAHWGWWFISPENREQERRSAHLLELAARMRDDGLLMQAHHCQWATQLNLGQLKACCHHIDLGLALYEAGAYGGDMARYGGHDAKVCGLGNAAIVAWLLGDEAAAQRRVGELAAWAPRTHHAASRAHALEAMIQVSYFARDPVSLKNHAQALIELSDEHGFAGYRAKATIYRGWLLAREGRIERGLELVRQGLAEVREVSTGEDSPFFANIQAELLSRSGAVDQAIAGLAQAMAEMEAASLQLWLPELQRWHGLLLARRGGSDIAEGEAWLVRAMRTASDQGARSLVKRAADSLAELRHREQRTELRPTALTATGGAYDPSLPRTMLRHVH